ncbi:lipopolysaccharide biosynthesis protein [Providencia vermicola]|uniref:lipopolysaccharide biosynthesis protein n=1 Tax=Providencia vermicola TaxID=333965 RepID=UPI0034E3EB7B
MNLLKNSSIYLISNILNAAIPFLLLPILTRYLTVEEYGQVAMFQMLLSGLATFIGLNTIGAATRKYYDDTSLDALGIFNGACIHLLIISSIICLFFSFFMGEQLSYFLSIPIKWIYIAIFISILTYIINFLLGQWQIRNEAKKFGILQVSNSIVNMLLSLIFVVALNNGADGRINAQLITLVIVSIFSITILYHKSLIKLFRFDFKKIKEAALYGVPLIPHHIGIFCISAIDRFFINQDLGLTDAGIYMVAVQLSSSLAILFDAINKAFVPWLFSKLKRNEYVEKIKIVKYTYIYFIILIFISLLAFIIGPIIFNYIAGDKYRTGATLIGWLCLGQIFGGMYLMVTNYIFYSKKTGKLALTTITTGIINIFMLIVFIPFFGLIGAAYAFAISKLCQFVFTWIISYNSVKMPWFKKEI